jgi:hypothetical protein
VEQRVEARMLLSAKEAHAGFGVRIGFEKPRECWTTRDYLESLSLQMYLRNLARNRHSEPTILRMAAWQAASVRKHMLQAYPNPRYYCQLSLSKLRQGGRCKVARIRQAPLCPA